MDITLLNRLFSTLAEKKIAVIGDFALDFYFNLQTNTQEFSVETGKEVFHASTPRSSLGGAGNVCKNLANLGAKASAFGIIGQDLFGREMLHQMDLLKINHQHLHISSDRGTPVYSKPMVGQEEFNRMDFGTTSPVERTQKEAFLFQTSLLLSSFDGVILNEQFLHPLLSASDVVQLQEALADSSIFAIADFRSLGAVATDVILKINLKEFSQVTQVPEAELTTLEQIKKPLEGFLTKRQKGVLLTLGELGILYADAKEMVYEKALPVKGPIDTVGAGDMVVAAFTAAMLSGATASEACQFANLCAHLSIHKIGETGSASPDEIYLLNKTYDG